MRRPPNDRFDLVVIGGGTGGLVSALVAAGVGARVALIERDRLGGDCLWTGCVPSKSLLAAANLAHRIRHADDVGLTAAEPVIDFSRVMAHVHAAREIIEPHDSATRLEREGVEVIIGDARFAGTGVIRVGERALTYRKAIVATGTRPVIPEVPGISAVSPLTSDTVWDLTQAPRSLVMIGGGAISCELAQAFTRLGVAVTVIEAGPRLLGREEPRASELITARLRAEGVTVRLGATVEAITAITATAGDGAGELTLSSADGPAGTELIAFDRMFVAVGRTPTTAGLELDRVGVETNADGSVRVDAQLRTTAEHIYAVGDVTGGPSFTHVAAMHARVASVNALFRTRRRVEVDAVPRVTFTDPEVASVGLSEASARERWPDAVLASFDYADLDRAITDGRRYGFVTLIGNPRGQLVGATIAAPGAGESIAELTAWVSRGAKIDEISQTVHAYPTLSEGPSRAADDYLRARYGTPRMRRMIGWVLAILRCVDRPA